LSRNAANWLHLERLRPVDDGQIVTNDKGEPEFEITVRRPELRLKLAEAEGCDKTRNAYYDRCGLVYDVEAMGRSRFG